MANPFIGGGKVRYQPGRVQSHLDTEVTPSDIDLTRELAHQRDLVAADILKRDRDLDILDAVIDDQMADFKLPANEAKEAAMRLCGSDVIDWECYKKAKALIEAAPIILNGYDPAQLAFTDRITKRKGPVLFNCRDFNPDTFFDSNYGDTPSTGDIDNPTGDEGDNSNSELPGDIQKRAYENQKKWSSLVLFWELIWGRPTVNPTFLEQLRENTENIQELQDRVAQLNAEGKTEEAQKLAEGLIFTKLPDIIRDERPASYTHLMWEASPVSRGPLNDVTSNPNVAASIWTDPWEFIKGKTGYRNKGIPAMKGGFLLPILIGGLGIVPKILSGVIKIRNKMTKKLKKLKRVPVVGKKLYKAWAVVTGLIYLPVVFINDIFIEICIWIALKPSGYVIDVGEIPQEYKGDIGEFKSTIDEKTTTTMDVEDTPAGFVPPECLTGAQEIVNKVNAHAVS